MSFRLHKRNLNGEGHEQQLVRATGGSPAKTNSEARWGLSTSKVASRRDMPHLGPVLLAIIVVAVLTTGLHLLYQ